MISKKIPCRCKLVYVYSNDGIVYLKNYPNVNCIFWHDKYFFMYKEIWMGYFNWKESLKITKEDETILKFRLI